MTLKTLGTDKKPQAKKKNFQQREHYFREEVLTHRGLVWRWKLYMVCSVEKGSHGSIKHFLPLCGQKKSKEKEIQHRERAMFREAVHTCTQRLNVEMKAFCGIFCGGSHGNVFMLLRSMKPFMPLLAYFPLIVEIFFHWLRFSALPNGRKCGKCFMLKHIEHCRKIYLQFNFSRWHYQFILQEVLSVGGPMYLQCWVFSLWSLCGQLW